MMQPSATKNTVSPLGSDLGSGLRSLTVTFPPRRLATPRAAPSNSLARLGPEALATNSVAWFPSTSSAPKMSCWSIASRISASALYTLFFTVVPACCSIWSTSDALVEPTTPNGTSCGFGALSASTYEATNRPISTSATPSPTASGCHSFIPARDPNPGADGSQLLRRYEPFLDQADRRDRHRRHRGRDSQRRLARDRSANTYSLCEVACRAKDPLGPAQVSARARRPRRAGPLAAVLSSRATSRRAGSCRRSRRSSRNRPGS